MRLSHLLQVKIIKIILQIHRFPRGWDNLVFTMKSISSIERKKIKRKDEKHKKKARNLDVIKDAVQSGNYISKKDKKSIIDKRLENGFHNGQKICIDCSMEYLMTDKECHKFVQQLCRLYGVNKASENPASLYLTGLNDDGKLNTLAIQKISGFQHLKIHRHSESIDQMFPSETKIVYLSPDSPNELDTIHQDTVYVIGGLVDEHIAKNESILSAKRQNISITARLPIDKYMVRSPGLVHYSQVLAMNQVFDILLTFLTTKCWKTSLSRVVPKRSGYQLTSES